MARLERLSPADLTNLAVEGVESPMHQAALGVLERGELFDAAGQVALDDIRRHIACRLDRVPELRRVLRQTHVFEGRPLWVDDATFDIARHVLSARLPAPGGEAAALEFAGRRMAELMDRSRPLWEIWFLEGYGPGRAGILIKLHHARADGRAMINLVAQLFDISPDVSRELAAPWSPQTPPSHRELIRENVNRKRATLARAARRMLHPATLAREVGVAVGGAIASVRQGRGAPRVSINTPIGPERRIAVVRLPLDQVKAVAHAYDAKVNDVFLAAVAGGFRATLLSRGEKVAGQSLRASMAVSLHPTGDTTTAGNLAGTVVVRLPLDAVDPAAAIARIARESREAKAAQHPFNPVGLMLFLARAGLTRRYIRRQRLVNVLTTNLPGPPVPLYFAGARLVDAIAIPPIAGNVTVSVAALSYAGTLDVSAVTDAHSWPDLEVLMGGIEASWAELARAAPAVPSREGRTALSA